MILWYCTTKDKNSENRYEIQNSYFGVSRIMLRLKVI